MCTRCTYVRARGDACTSEKVKGESEREGERREGVRRKEREVAGGRVGGGGGGGGIRGLPGLLSGVKGTLVMDTGKEKDRR
jgi:hypothetical protein